MTAGDWISIATAGTTCVIAWWLGYHTGRKQR